MVGIIRAELDLLGRRRSIIEIDLRHPVAHAGPIVELIPVVADAPVQICLLGNQIRLYPHMIAVVSHRRIGKQLRGQDMVPAERRYGVSPAEAQVLVVLDGPSRLSTAVTVLIAVIEIVQPVVNIEIQAVPVTEPMREFGIKIVEKIVPVETGEFDDRGQQEGVHSPRANRVGSLAFPDGPFQVKLVANHAHAKTPVSLVEVAIVRPHIDDTGNTATVSGGERALV